MCIALLGCPNFFRQNTVSLLLTSDGGEVEVETRNGALLVMYFPENSIGGEAEITLTPLEPTDKSWLRVELGPPGQQLWQPVEIMVAVPNGVELNEFTSLAFGNGDASYPIPTEIDFNNRMLYATAYSLGYVFDEAKQTVNPHQIELEVVQLTCPLIVATGHALLETLKIFPNFATGHALYSLIRTITTELECEEDAEQLIEDIREVGCAGLKSAKEDALEPGIEIKNIDDFKRYFVPAYVWAGEAKAVGATDCGTGSGDVGTDVVETAGSLYDNLSLHFDGLAGTMDPDDFEKLRKEAKSLFELASELTALDLGDEANELLYDVFQPVIATLRNLAYAMSRTDEDVVWLTRATAASLGIPPGVIDFDEKILDDIQYCLTTDVKLVSKNGNGDELGKVEGLGGGAMPGMQTTTGMLPIMEEGKLTLSGDILGFQCHATPDPIDAEDEIIIRLNGTRVRALSKPRATGDFLAASANIDISQIFNTAGITYTGGQTYTLTIVRKRPQLLNEAETVEYCPLYLYGAREYELFTIELEAQDDEIKFNGNNPGTFDSNTNITQNGLLARLGTGTSGSAVLRFSGLTPNQSYNATIRATTDEANGAPDNTLTMSIGTASITMRQTEGLLVERTKSGTFTADANGEVTANVSASGGSGTRSDHCYVIDIVATPAK
jgi:hypothetical protein